MLQLLSTISRKESPRNGSRNLSTFFWSARVLAADFMSSVLGWAHRTRFTSY